MDGEERLKTMTFSVLPRHIALLDKWAAEVDRSRAWMLRKLVDDEEKRREAASEPEAA